MSPITLSHIVPTFYPQIDGAGDYALNLARHLRESHGIHSRFIVCDPQWGGPSNVEGFPTRRLRRRDEAGLWSLLVAGKDRPQTAVLHYAGHRYHKHGVPVWLDKGIKSWLADGNDGIAESRRQLLTVFHELSPASAKPWEKDFFVSNLQRWLIKRLHRRSQFSVTGTQRMQADLENMQPNKTLCLPMPSNVPIMDPPKAGRRRNSPLRIAIFGGTDSRSASVKVHANLLDILDKKKMLASVMLLGSGPAAAGLWRQDVDLLQKKVSPERIEVLGELSAAEVSRTLGRADIFLSHHSGAFACKSGAVMAALGAGCPAVLRDGRNAAPLCENEHFIASDDSRSSVERFERLVAEGHLQRIAAAGRSWYEQHADWKVIAHEYGTALSQRTFRLRGPVEVAKSPVRAVESINPADIYSRVSIG